MILALCDTAEILSVIRIIKIIIIAIKVTIPIIIIVTGIIAYMESLKDGDSTKATKSLINKAIAALCVFFIPTIISFTINMVGSDSEVNQCLKNATSEGITTARVNHAQRTIDNLEKNFSEANYRIASNAIRDIDDESNKEEMLKQLSEYEDYLEIQKRINKLKSKFDRTEYSNLYKEVEELENESVKETLLSLLESIGDKPLDVGSGTYSFTNGSLTYKVYIPENATVNMPLMLYLHGDGGGEDRMYNYAVKAYGNEFPFIIIGPHGGMWAETSGRLQNLKNIVDEVCNKYSCDTTRITVSGHSRGAIGTWAMVNTYPNLFYSAIPLSCRGTINASNFLHTKLIAYCGNQGDDINYYYSSMKSNVDKIKKAGGNATFITVNGGHGSTPAAAFTKSTFEWMIN